MHEWWVTSSPRAGQGSCSTAAPRTAHALLRCPCSMLFEMRAFCVLCVAGARVCVCCVVLLLLTRHLERCERRVVLECRAQRACAPVARSVPCLVVVPWHHLTSHLCLSLKHPLLPSKHARCKVASVVLALSPSPSALAPSAPMPLSAQCVLLLVALVFLLAGSGSVMGASHPTDKVLRARCFSSVLRPEPALLLRQLHFLL